MVKFNAHVILFLFTSLLSLVGSAQVTSNFKASETQGCGPLVVAFTDLSSGAGINSWFWDFGNGNTSVLQNPTSTYYAAGTYTVKLTVSNGSVTNTKSTTGFITVLPSPEIKFNVSTTGGCAPLVVNFTDQSNANGNTIQSYNWSFGDGTESTLQNPTHTYNTGSDYTVVLQVTNQNGCSSTYENSDLINVKSSNITPLFSASPPIACSAPANITFTNKSTSDQKLTYSWTFGDTHTSTLVNPSNTYSQAGNYNVTLTATDSVGCAKSYTSIVSVVSPNTVSFTTSASSNCLGDSLTFRDLTIPTPTAWFWDFGDGSTSNLQNPSYAYANTGIYSVKLKVILGGLCPDSLTKSAYVNVHPTPVINFTSNATTACKAPFTVNFQDQTVGATSWKWYLGDGTTATTQKVTHTYLKTGSDSVTLYAYTAYGCKDSLTQYNYIQITPPPVHLATVVDSGCAPLKIHFSDSVPTIANVAKWQWNFGDPTSGLSDTDTIVNPIHTFNATGSYNVILQVTTNQGCTNSDTTHILVSPPPTVNFSVKPINACAQTIIHFQDSSLNATSWLWRFGDKSTAIGQKPMHAYLDTGYFNLTEVVYNHGCADSVTRANAVYMHAPVPKFTSFLSCTNVFQREFINQSIGADKWYWNFGDGSPIDSVDFSIKHTFPDTSSYEVTLTTKSIKGGCTTDTILIVPIIQLHPQFSISSKIGCPPFAVTLTDKTTGGKPSAYFWDFGSGYLPSNSSNSATTYFNPGVYTVKMMVTDKYGCLDSIIKTDSVSVLNMIPKFSVLSQKNKCDSLQVMFSDSSKGTPAITSWIWEFGDGTTLLEPNASKPIQHSYKSANNDSAVLYVTNSQGTCASAPAIINFIKPLALDTLPITFNCIGKATEFYNNSINSNKYFWNFGDGPAYVNQFNGTHTYSKNGFYTIRLVAIDSLTGCTDTLVQTRAMQVGSPVAAFTSFTPLQGCSPLSISLTDTSTSHSPIVSRYWNFGNGNAGISNSDSVYTVYGNPGNYAVELIVTDSLGCTDTLTKPNFVQVHGPTGTYQASNSSGCVPLSETFDLKLNNTSIDTLDFGDGNIYIGNGNSNPTHTYTAPGTYHTLLILTDAFGCHTIDTTKTIIEAHAIPVVNFSFGPADPEVGQPVQFTDLSTNATSWNWTFGDATNESSAASQSPTHVYDKGGVYTVKETVDSSSGGCVESITKTITILSKLIIPNVFSPNNDGVNDFFFAQAYGISQIEIVIVDRWGHEVYSKTDNKINWDGKNNGGGEVAAGTYFYTIKATPEGGGKVSTYNGFVELLR